MAESYKLYIVINLRQAQASSIGNVRVEDIECGSAHGPRIDQSADSYLARPGTQVPHSLKHQVNGFDSNGDACCSLRNLVLTLTLASVLAGGFPLALSAAEPPEHGMISAGAYHVTALKGDGSIWAWGENSSAQVELGLLEAVYLVPQNIEPAGSAVAVSSGGFHTLGLRANGTVFAWGRNMEGQLGTSTGGLDHVDVPGLTDVTMVSAGGYHSLGLTSSGTVWAWGANWNGQLGDGTTQSRATPAPIPGLTNVIAIAAGTLSSYAVTSDGTVWAWGGNSSNQLGSGAGVDQSTPVAVPSLNNVIAVAAGWEHASALKDDGTVWSWGWGWQGQLGTGSTIIWGSTEQPQQAVGIDDAVAVAAGSSHTVIIREDGSMWAWGDNWSGQLGDGVVRQSTLDAYPHPSAVTANAAQISAGAYTTFVLRQDGTLAAFGYNELGQMGNGTTQGYRLPVQSFNQTGGALVSGGRFHSSVLRDDGTVGWMGFYQTGNLFIGGADPNDQSFELKSIANLTDVNLVASGDSHTVAQKNDGTVWAWGSGGWGQLGDANYSTSMSPVQAIGLTNVVEVAARGASSLALRSDGSLWAWGANDFGQLGDGTTNPSGVPTQVIGLTNVATASIGLRHTLAVRNDGTVWGWGGNANGHLIAAGNPIIDQPTQISGISNAISARAGSDFSLVLLDNGEVLAWGQNDRGQLGLGDLVPRSSPTLIPLLANVEQISVGSDHSLARLADGTVKAWGANQLGQVGNNMLFADQVSPVAVSVLTNVNDLEAGHLHSLAVRSNGSVWGWGNNGNEQLGVSVRNERRSVIRLRSDPTDTDADGMPDAWEMFHFGTLNRDGSGDADQDGLVDIQEFLLATDPNNPDTDNDGLNDIADPNPSSGHDADSNGLPDWWEMLYFGQTGVDPTLDLDSDGLSIEEEYLLGTDPTNPDTSGDGLPDGWKVFHGLDPLADDSQTLTDGIPIHEHAWPSDPAAGQLTISILTPVHGSTL